MKKLLKGLLSMTLLWTSLHVIKAQESHICTQFTGSNIDKQNYQNIRNWADPMYSYLEKTSDGWMRLIADKGIDGYIVDYFDEAFNETYRLELSQQLPIFGGFHASENAYFIVSGQVNNDEDDTKEVVRVSKYDKQWNLIKSTAISNINTTVPFDAGSLRMDDDGTYLMIRTSHEMYATQDGVNHQANMTFQINMNDMSLTDSFTRVLNKDYGYVSHSFNQFIKVDDISLIAVDHGDANPRSIALFKYNTNFKDGKFTKENKESIQLIEVLPFAGQLGANYTGATVGGLEISDTHYLVAASSVAQDGSEPSDQTANILIGAVNKSTLACELLYKTDYMQEEMVSTPQLVKVNDDRFVVLYEVNQKVHYIIVDDTGKTIQEAQTIEGSLSDCQPIVYDNTLTWFTYNKDETTFYQLNIDTHEMVQKKVNTGHDYQNVGEVNQGYIEVECSKCHEKAVIRGITGISAYWNETGTGSFSSYVNTKIEVGKMLYCLVDVTYADVQQYDFTDEVVVTLDDPSVMSYEPNGMVDCLKGLKDGICYVTFASKYQPHIKTVFKFTVGKGGIPSSLEIPRNVKIINGDETGSVVLNWDAVEGASSYEVYYKTAASSEYTLIAMIRGENVKITNFTPGQTYEFYVKAKNEKTTSQPSESVQITLKEKVPDKVINVKVKQDSYKDVTLTWDGVEGATSYDVYRKAYKEDSVFTLFKTVEDTTLSVSGLMTGKEYSFYVVAKNEAGVSLDSDIVSIKTQLEGKPTLVIEQVSKTKFTLSWSEIDGATRYLIYRKRGDDPWKKVLTLGIEDSSYTTSEMPEGEYSFIVKAGRYDSKDRVMTGSSNTVKGTSTYAKPAITLTAGTKQIKVSWSAIEGVKYYEVYRATSEDGKYTKLKTTTATSYTAKSLASNKEYYFKVRGYKSYNNGEETTKIYTSYSEVKAIKAK